MAESDIESLDTDVSTLKTDISNVKTALNSKQDTITGAASTIVDDNLAAGKVLVSDSNGKVSTASAGIDDINPDGKYLKLTGGTLTGALNIVQPAVGALGLGEVGNRYAIEYDKLQNIFSLMKNGSTTESASVSLYGDSDNFIFNHTNSAGVTSSIVLEADKVILRNVESRILGDLRLTGVADATQNNDAVNLSQLKQYLPLAGGAMTGNLNLGGETLFLNTNGYSLAQSSSGYFLLEKDRFSSSIYIEEESSTHNLILAKINTNIKETGIVIKDKNIQLYSTVSSENLAQISGVADATTVYQAVNLKQLQEREIKVVKGTPGTWSSAAVGGNVYRVSGQLTLASTITADIILLAFPQNSVINGSMVSQPVINSDVTSGVARSSIYVTFLTLNGSPGQYSWNVYYI